MVYSAKIADAYVDVKTNTKDYERGVSGLKSSLGNLAKITAVAFATKKLFDFGASAVKIASDFEETRQRFEVIFKGIGKEAEEASRRIASDFDLASGTVKKMLSNTGDLLTGLGFTKEEALKMSEATAKLAGDLASFNDVQGGAEEAAEKLTSAMLGNTRAAQESLKIKILQNKEFNKEVDIMMRTKNITKQQAKAWVILAQAQRQSKNALGDYARTSDSFANQQRKVKQQWIEFKDSMGQVILRFIEAINVVPKLSEKMGKLNSLMKELTTGNVLDLWIANLIAEFKALGLYMIAPFKALGTFIGTFVFNTSEKFAWMFKKIKMDSDETWDELKKRLPSSIDAVTNEIEEMGDKLNKIEEERQKRIAEILASQKAEGDGARKAADEVVRAEASKQSAFYRSEQVMEKLQEGIAKAGIIKGGGIPQLGAVGAMGPVGNLPKADNVRPDQNRINDFRNSTGNTQVILSNILDTIKIGNQSLKRIDNNTKEFLDANTVFV